MADLQTIHSVPNHDNRDGSVPSSSQVSTAAFINNEASQATSIGDLPPPNDESGDDEDGFLPFGRTKNGQVEEASYVEDNSDSELDNDIPGLSQMDWQDREATDKLKW